MTGEHIVRARTRNIIKFNADLWNTICSFAEENYDTCGAIVETTAETKTFDDMDAAYEYICGNTESINTITVLADYKDEQLEIGMYNQRTKGKYSMEIYCECIDGDRESKVRKFALETVREKTNIKGRVLYSLLLIIPYSFMIAERFLRYILGSDDLKTVIEMTQIFITVVCIIFSIYIIYAALLCLGLLPVNVYGKKGIKYLINYEEIAYEAKRERNIRVFGLIFICVWISSVIAIELIII